MNNKLKLIFIILSLSLLAEVIFAKEVTLFEQSRGQEKKSIEKKIPPAKQEKKNKSTKPLEIKLVGIQDFGGTYYTLMFKDKKGKRSRYKWQKESHNEPIELETGYVIEGVNQRRIIVRINSEKICQDDPKQQIHCQSSKLLELGIKRTAFKQPRVAKRKKGNNKGVSKNKNGLQVKKKPAAVSNPFLSILKGQGQKK